MTLPRPLSCAEVRRYDQRAIASGIPGIVLMENAALGATEVLLAVLGAESPEGSIPPGQGPIVVVCGKGNNGGDGFVMARLLRDRGLDTQVELLADPAELRGDARIAYERMVARDVPVRRIDEGFTDRLSHAWWVVDALLGTGTTGSVRPEFASAIGAIVESGRPVFAVDLPSGLDGDTGTPLGPTIQARHTATFVAPKLGFDHPEAKRYTGVVHVVDIGAGPVEELLGPVSPSPV